MDGFKVQLASDILERDGLGLELYSPAHARLAEVFRSDAIGGLTFRAFQPFEVPHSVIEWFFSEARTRL